MLSGINLNILNEDENLEDDVLEPASSKKNDDELKLEQKILLTEGEIIYFNNSLFSKLSIFEKASNNLQNHNLGKYEYKKKCDKASKRAHCFFKTNYDSISDKDEKLDFC